MPFKLRLSPGGRQSVDRYLKRFEVAEDQLEALAQIKQALKALAANPRLGVTPRGIVGVPTYRFTIRIRGVGYYVRATFNYSQDEKAIVITRVEQQLL